MDAQEARGTVAPLGGFESQRARSSVQRWEIVLLAAAVFVALGIRLYFYTGLIASDDLSHCHASYRIMSPEVIRADHIPLAPETIDAFQGRLRGSANVRRLGVNVPLALSMRLFGVHEWSIALVPLTFSLAGVLVVFALGRTLAGPGGGALAAWLWACVPIDAYMATVCLQDNIFATVYAVFLLFLIRSEQAAKRRWLWALAAGATLGYMQYVKEVGWMMFGPLGLWAVYSTWARRRVDWRVVSIFCGFLLVQVIIGCFYWWAIGDFLFYWRLTLRRLFDVYGTRTPTYPYPQVFHQAYKYLCQQWVLGYAVLAFPVFVVAALWSRRTPARVLLLLLLATQTFIWLEATKWMNWTQRYSLQLSTLFIVFTVAGVQALLSWLPRRWARGMAVAVGLALLAATAAALRPEWQQHGRFRGEVIRRAYDYVMAAAGEQDTIYFDISHHVPFYTKRMFETLNGFERIKGGIGTLEEARAAETGWVVVSHLEQGHMHRRPDAPDPTPPPNWIEVFRAENRGGNYYARVFKILPEAPPHPLKIIDRPTFPAEPQDVSAFEFHPVSFADDLSQYLSRWKRDSLQVELERLDEGLRCEITGDPDSQESQYGGVRFDVAGLQALRLSLSLTNPENVCNLYVYAYGRKREQLMRWHWSINPRQRMEKFPDPLVFVPGQPTGYFRLTSKIPPAEVRTIEVFIRIEPGTRAGFVLHRAEAAQYFGPPGAADTFDFTPVDLTDVPAADRRSTRVGASKSVDLEPVAGGGIRCYVQGDPASLEHQFGGVMFGVDGIGALRLAVSLIDPQSIVGLWVDGCDERDRRIVRWEWRLDEARRVPEGPMTHILVPGESTAFFAAAEAGDGNAVRTVHVFLRLVPGTAAGFVLHSAETASHLAPARP